jgi:hypothetical protein
MGLAEWIVENHSRNGVTVHSNGRRFITIITGPEYEGIDNLFTEIKARYTDARIDFTTLPTKEAAFTIYTSNAEYHPPNYMSTSIYVVLTAVVTAASAYFISLNPLN